MKKIFFFACVALAVFGCGGDDGDLPPFGWFKNNFGSCTYYNGGCSNDVPRDECRNGSFAPNRACNSSSSIPSSSSYGYSSSSRNIVYGASVTYGSETYQTVVIGTQTWFARNLNYNVSGSVCYNNQDSYCEDYGRLYNWVTAMNLSSSCNSSTCSGQISTKHQGICPTGWHIPSDTEWSILINYVDGTGSDTRRDSPTAGRYLKATSGWNSNGNSQDTYGFAALPGGGGNSDGYFGNVGNYGNWWSTTEYNAYFVYIRNMGYNTEYARWHSIYKTDLQSVRCVQD